MIQAEYMTYFMTHLSRIDIRSHTDLAGDPQTLSPENGTVE